MMNYFAVLIVITLVILYQCNNGSLSSLISSSHIKGFQGNALSLDGIALCGSEDGKYYDKSQFLYKSLNTYFGELSRGEKRLIGELDGESSCEKKVYTKDTIDEILKIDLNQVIGYVLEKVNENPLFKFSFVKYENVIIMKDQRQNRRYIIDFHVNDKITHYGLRLKLDVVKFVVQNRSGGGRVGGGHVGRGSIGEEGDGFGVVGNRDVVFTAPAFRRYYPGYPTLEQMIPLPMDVIPTGNIVIGGCGKETIVPVPFRYLHINSIVIENSTWTLDVNNRCNSLCAMNGGKGIEGVQNTTLPFGVETRRDDGTNVGPFIQHFNVRNKWPKLIDEPKDNHLAPCQYNDGVCWDDEGIPIKKKTMEGGVGKVSCLGKVSATTKYPTRPNYWPSNYAVPQNSGEYFWLFDRTRGDYAMPGKK